MPRAKTNSKISPAGKTELWDQIVVHKKTQSYQVKETGGESSYTFWIASWEVPKDRLPVGAKKKRITASGPRQEVAKANLVLAIPLDETVGAGDQGDLVRARLRSAAKSRKSDETTSSANS